MSAHVLRRVIIALAVALVAVVALGALSGCADEPKEPDNYAEKSPLVSEVTTSTTSPDELLTVEDVERVSGIAGVQSIPQGASERAIGNLNFANDKGGIFLVVRIGNSEQFDGSKAGSDFGEATTGVGDEAYIGPAKSRSATPNMLVFRKGTDSAALTVFFSAPEQTVLSIDQLKELGNLMAERF